MQHEQHPHTPARTDTGIAADTATGTTPATQPPAPARRPRLLRTSARLALGAAVVLLLAAIGLWCWLGAQQSLAQALALLQRHMPAGTSLQVEGVRGNLLQGGHIDKLIYRQHAPAPANANAPTPSGALPSHSSTSTSLGTGPHCATAPRACAACTSVASPMPTPAPRTQTAAPHCARSPCP